MTGQQIHNYTITGYLGEGGMGTVYKATDRVLGRDVALKMLHTVMINQPQVLERFKKEAQVLARLLHPNIAVIYNLIEQDNHHFMVMEYVEGKNLDELLKQHGRLSYKIAVPVFMQALDGLQHAHKKGIFHRDIKPSNLILTPDGTLKLMDFGIAKIAGEQRLTQVNRVIGTVEFLAPEIIEGKDPSVSSDIYATGVTLYEMLTGQLPFAGNSDYNLMQDILKKKPLPPDKLNSDIPKALSDIVMKMLEKKPEHRFPDALAFQRALTAAFPDLRSADISFHNVESIQAQAAPAVTRLVGNESEPLPATRMPVMVRPVAIAQQLHEKYLPGRKRKLQAATLLLLLLVLGFFTYRILNTNGRPATNSDLAETPGTTPVSSSKSNGGGFVQEDVSQPVVLNAPVVTPTPEPVKKKPEEKRTVVPVEKKETQPEEKQPAPVEKKVRAPKTIEIRSRVNVEIRLAERVVVDNLSEGQTLHFVVADAVEYENETIIRRGAPVTATVKGIGRVLIAVTINSVEAVNGQKIMFGRAGLTKPKKDFGDGKTYSISLGKGAVITL